MSYDPLVPPDRAQWLALAEQERLDQVLAYHERVKATVANLRLHAALHVTVENQLAEPYGAVVAAMERLLGEGLDRHEALHAVGSVVAEQMRQVLRSGRPVFDRAAYEGALAALTAEAWRSGWSDPHSGA